MLEVPVEEYPPICENAMVALRDRYLDRKNGEVVETPDGMFRRVAKCLASVEEEQNKEKMEEKFYHLLRSLKYLPNSPTLMNAGRPLGQLFACFVLPIPDNIEGIMRAATDTALVQRSGGGCGYTLDKLRPSGSIVGSSGGTTSGPISFWRMLNEVTSAIQQGSFRRGANMMMMDIQSPEILKFLFVKQNLSQFTAYNISVKVSDEFMRSLGSGKPHVLIDKHNKTKWLLPRRLLGVVQDAVAKSLVDLSASRCIDNCYGIKDLVPAADAPEGDYITSDEIWNMLSTNAHATGAPGICFIDRIRESEPTPHVGLIDTSNPCGEAFLLPNEACVLGSIDLSKFVDVDFKTWGSSDWKHKVRWSELKEAIQLGVRMLDNTIDANSYPTKDIHDMVKANRKIGLGVMGFADMLFKLGIKYDSNEGHLVVDEVMDYFDEIAVAASCDLAEERGSFPNFIGSRWDIDAGYTQIRNAEVTSQAPTGTISIIANCSCGIEPIYSLAFKRNVLDGKTLTQTHSFFRELLEYKGVWDDSIAEEAMKHGSIQHLTNIDQSIRDVFVCAHDVSPQDHVAVQAIVQRFISNAVSKTINMDNKCTVADVDAAYKFAHKTKCKAVTVYRDGSRVSQPMQLKNNADVDAKASLAVGRVDKDQGLLDPPEVPEVAPSVRIRQPTAFGNLHVSVVYDPATHTPLEVFAQCGSTGGIEQADMEAICRTSSLLLRSRYPIYKLIDQLYRPTTGMQKSEAAQITSLPRALALALSKFVEIAEQHDKINMPANAGSNGNGRLPREEVAGYRIACPKGNGACSGVAVMNGRCVTCSCGASTCG